MFYTVKNILRHLRLCASALKFFVCFVFFVAKNSTCSTLLKNLPKNL